MSFKAIQKQIEGEGYSAKSAGAILAKKSRQASPAAKRKNPRLKRVGGPKFQSDNIASKMLADSDKDGM